MKETIIIVDRDKQYLQRIQQFFVPVYVEQLTVICCDSEDALRTTLCTQPGTVTLIAENMLSELQSLLVDRPIAVLTEERDWSIIPDAKKVWKYQRVDAIYQELLKVIQEKETAVLFVKPKCWNMFLFQGASGGVGTSLFAEVCARNLRMAGKRVLYVNLENTGTAGFYFRGEGGMDIQKFEDAFRNGIETEKLVNQTVKMDGSGVAFFDSVRNAMDNSRLDMGILLKALNKIGESNLFDYCVIDKPFTVEEEHKNWMKTANNIIFISDGSDVGNLKFARIFLNIEKEITEKCCLLYNKVRTDNFRELSHFKLPVLGKVEYLQSTIRENVERELVTKQLFAQLMK